MLFCSGQDEPEPLLLTGGTALSPQDIMEFGRQLAGQVETRLQTRWFFLLSSFFSLGGNTLLHMAVYSMVVGVCSRS